MIDLQGHLLSLGGSPTNPRIVTKGGHPNKEGYYRLGIWHLQNTVVPPDDICHGWSPTIFRKVSHQPKDGQPPTLGWSPTKKKCTTDLEFGT